MRYAGYASWLLFYDSPPLGEKRFDAAVSAESLHHFSQKRKISLYQKLQISLKDNGYFVLTDYMAETEAEERENFRNLLQLKREWNLTDREDYHFDTPLTREHEIEALRSGGFSYVEVLKTWGHTCTLKAYK